MADENVNRVSEKERVKEIIDRLEEIQSSLDTIRESTSKLLSEIEDIFATEK